MKFVSLGGRGSGDLYIATNEGRSHWSTPAQHLAILAQQANGPEYARRIAALECVLKAVQISLNANDVQMDRISLKINWGNGEIEQVTVRFGD